MARFVTRVTEHRSLLVRVPLESMMTIIRFLGWKLRPALLLMLYLPFQNVAFSQDAMRGAWQGTLSGPGYAVPFTFELDGVGGGTFRSPTQNFTGGLQYSVDGIQVTIHMPSIHAKIEAKLNGEEMTGTWSQLLTKRPFRLVRIESPKPAPSIPQAAPVPTQPAPPAAPSSPQPAASPSSAQNDQAQGCKAITNDKGAVDLTVKCPGNINGTQICNGTILVGQISPDEKHLRGHYCFNFEPGTYTLQLDNPVISYESPSGTHGLIQLPGEEAQVTVIAGQTTKAIFDLTRPEYLARLSAEQRAQLEEAESFYAKRDIQKQRRDQIYEDKRNIENDIMAKQFDEAEQLARKEISLDPDDFLFWYELARVQVGQKKYDDALVSSKTTIDRITSGHNPPGASLNMCYFMAQIYVMKGEFSKIQDARDAVVHAQPLCSSANFGVANP